MEALIWVWPIQSGSLQRDSWPLSPFYHSGLCEPTNNSSTCECSLLLLTAENSVLRFNTCSSLIAAKDTVFLSQKSIKMGFISLLREFRRAFYFLCSVQFWRMALLWTLSLLFSYLKLFKDYCFEQLSYWQLLLLKAEIFSHKLKSYPRCSPAITPVRPVCVITGVSLLFGLAIWFYPSFFYHSFH